MINDERITTFINSFDTGLSKELAELEKYAKETNVPIIRPQMQNLMKVLLKIKEPVRILEVGCAIGFSALLMREYAPEGCKITTIENYEPRIAEAKVNLSKYDTTNQIRLLEGDAVQILAELGQKGSYSDVPCEFDMIFMDAAKGQYINMYDDVKRLLKKGGLLLTDNVLQEGDILESRYAVTRRDRTIHSRMRDYLYKLTHDVDYATSILTLADGVAMSVKK